MTKRLKRAVTLCGCVMSSCLLFLTGCGYANGAAQSTDASQSAFDNTPELRSGAIINVSASDNKSDQKPVYDPDMKLEMVTGDSLINSGFAISGNGCYELYLNSDGNARMIYTDMEAGESTWLSESKFYDKNGGSETLENTACCFEDAIGGATVFTANDRLFSVLFGCDTPSRIFVSDLDGRNMRTLVTLSDYAMLSGAVACDSEYLYTLVINSDNETEAIRIDMETGAMENCFTLPECNVFLESAFDDCLIIKTICRPDTTDGEDTEEIYKNSIHKVYRCSLTNKQITEIKQWKQDMVYEAFDGQYMQLVDVALGNLVTVDLKTGKSEERATLAELGISGEDASALMPIYDNHLICPMKGDVYKAIDLTTLKVTDLGYIENTYRFPMIQGEFGDKFLVIVGNDIMPTPDHAPDGTPITTDVHWPKKALIDKKDYWNGNYNLQEITNAYLEN